MVTWMWCEGLSDVSGRENGVHGKFLRLNDKFFDEKRKPFTIECNADFNNGFPKRNRI